MPRSQDPRTGARPCACLVVVVGILASGAMIGGCEMPQPPPPQTVQQEEASPPAQEYHEEVDAQFAELDAQLNELQDQVGLLLGDARQSAEMKLFQLRKKRQELAASFDEEKMTELLHTAEVTLGEFSVSAQQGIDAAGKKLDELADQVNQQITAPAAEKDAGKMK